MAYVALLVVLTLLTMRRPIYGVAALIFLQPFALYGDVFHTTITLSKIALAALLLGLVVRSGNSLVLWEPYARRFLIAGGLLVAVTTLSIAQAQHVFPALRETFKALEYVVMFGAVYVAYRIDSDRAIIEKAITVIAIVVALIAISQEFNGAPSGMYLNNQIVPRVAGPLEGPNQLAGYLDVMLPLLLAFTIGASSRVLNSAIALATFADVLTFSRAGALGVIAGTLAIVLIYRRNLRAPLSSMFAGVVSGAIVGVAWGFGVHSFNLYRPGNLSSVLSSPSYAGRVGSRSELWHAALRLWLRHPWLGIGADNFELELQSVGLNGVRTHANSLYIESMVDGGVPLFAATLWLTWTSIATFVRDRAQSPLIAGALAASVALALHQVVDFLTFYPKIGGFWWIVLGLGAAELARVNALKKAPACG